MTPLPMVETPHCRVNAGSANVAQALGVKGAPHGVKAPPWASVMNCGVVGAMARNSASWSLRALRFPLHVKPNG